MPLPSLKEQFAALIAAPSVSCTQPAWDQSNLAVIELLASWLGDLGFACEVQTIAPGKANLLATYGSGPGGLVLAGHSDTVPFDAALAQKMSDRAVRVIQATEAGELLPRGFSEASHFECKFCPYAQRCWGGAS